MTIFGTAFFGLLGGGIGIAVDHRSDHLRAQLTTPHVAPDAQDRIVAGLRTMTADETADYEELVIGDVTDGAVGIGWRDDGGELLIATD
ncbi:MULTISPECIES: hypothetical protein [unclassified Streptomyces]|uniref:hypothetical protein n=1 Tax=unclassified Streptomyces TaxID=2593676 RepID=UPI0030CE0483